MTRHPSQYVCCRRGSLLLLQGEGVPPTLIPELNLAVEDSLSLGWASEAEVFFYLRILQRRGHLLISTLFVGTVWSFEDH